MMVDHAREADRDEIADLYARNRPDQSGRLTDAVQILGTATFVTRDGANHVTGFAMVIAMDCGVRPYGIIHQLEVSLHSSKQTQSDIRDALVDACVTWLAEHGVSLVYASANAAESLPKAPRQQPSHDPGQANSWYVDTDTGYLKPERRPGDTRPAPAPLQMARYVGA
jgi:hypothetical protein